MLPFCRFRRQRCIKIPCPKDPDFYTLLALKTAKGQHLPALEVYTNQSPMVPKEEEPPKKPQESADSYGFLRKSVVFCENLRLPNIGGGPNTVSESTVSNTELSEFFCPHRVPGGESSVSSSQPIICEPKQTHRVLPRTHRVCLKTQ